VQGGCRIIGARLRLRHSTLQEPSMEQQATPYKQMTPRQKFKFVLKLVVCILSFGMLFPNVMSD
jgi:hypothetical protein